MPVEEVSFLSSRCRGGDECAVSGPLVNRGIADADVRTGWTVSGDSDYAFF